MSDSSLVGLGLKGEGVDRPADLGAEDVIYEAVLVYATEAVERGSGHSRAKVVAAAGVVKDLGAGARNRLLDAALQILGGRHALKG